MTNRAIRGLLQWAQLHVIQPRQGAHLKSDATGLAECKECGLVWCRDTRSIHLLLERRRAEHASTEDQVYGYIPQPIRDALRAYIYGVRPIPLTERVRILGDTWLYRLGLSEWLMSESAGQTGEPAPSAARAAARPVRTAPSM